jgi:putative intracellular protease/amidase
MKRNVLILVTGADRLANGKETGIWLEEFAVPYYLLKEAGFGIVVASPKGGATPLDPTSLDGEVKRAQWAEAEKRLQQTLPLVEVMSDDFDALFLPGGHGTMIDLPDNADLKALLNRFARADKVIAAVCHGPAGLVGARKGDGTPLVAGKTITAFTDAEERAVGLDDAVPFLLESRLREEGAQFVVGDNWASHVEVDGTLITGQNPASSEAVARAVISLLA